MIKTVLLQGFIDDSCKRYVLLQEINGKKEIQLIINSGGGLLRPALELIQYFQVLEKSGTRIYVDIHEAKSMAAVIACSIGQKRSMRKSSAIEFHRGSIELEASDFDLETGMITRPSLEAFWRYHTLLEGILSKHQISSNTKLMAQLHGSNWLPLDAESCLRFGLVHEIL